MGTPLTRASQIIDPEAVSRALDALLHGGDEPADRDTRAKGWDEGVNDMEQKKMWYEELSDIDAAISESVEVRLTALPTGELVDQIEECAQRLSTWYAAAVPVFQKRMLHIHYDELAEVAGDLRGGKINAAEAKARYQTIMADVAEIEGFSKFFMTEG
jgi:hypothetical protein